MHSYAVMQLKLLKKKERMGIQTNTADTLETSAQRLLSSGLSVGHSLKIHKSSVWPFDPYKNISKSFISH